MMFLFGLAHLSASTLNAHNDFLVDHGLGTSDDHFIINITELASVNPSILIRSIPIRSIPIVDFNPRKFEDCVECVLCLSDLADGDKAKLLPSCKHWFHAHCIDAWLESQATCPICKTRVRLFQTNEPSSGNLICCDEHSADMTAVVVDIPTTFEVGDLGPITTLTPL
ncbi:BnaC03g69130D [Brassica napus]|uniref:RING-type E3 ubiquitin transferase n=1 Tax=Brassica napus TaxID=3708 RepID=A0A078I9H6_BRANA|nr:BnaC03g69130D [Brassica napus]